MTAPRRLLLAAAVLAYLGIGFYLSRALVTWDDEGSYLALGRMLLRGELASLFQDELSGHRLPLPFAVLGLTQVVLGPNLWWARLVSLLIGLGALGLAAAVARRLAGDVAGVLAALLLATQGVVVGYYATAMYFSLTSAILLTTIWLLLRTDLRAHAVLAMAVASLLFFTRTNLYPALPFFALWALAMARDAAARGAIVLLAIGPPLAFFAADPLHLKLLAYLPLLHRLVEPLGYRSIVELQELSRPGVAHQLWSVGLVARRYESWMFTALGLGLAWLMARAGPREPWLSPVRVRSSPRSSGGCCSRSSSSTPCQAT